MTLDDWYDWAALDAERRDLPALKPLLDAQRAATRHVRAGDWNDDASGTNAGGTNADPMTTETRDKGRPSS
jgi:hypothetical protein